MLSQIPQNCVLLVSFVLIIVCNKCFRCIERFYRTCLIHSCIVHNIRYYWFLVCDTQSINTFIQSGNILFIQCFSFIFFIQPSIKMNFMRNMIYVNRPNWFMPMTSILNIIIYWIDSLPHIKPIVNIFINKIFYMNIFITSRFKSIT